MDIAQVLQLEDARKTYPQLDFVVDESIVTICPRGEEAIITVERALADLFECNCEIIGRALGVMISSTDRFVSGSSQTCAEHRPN